MEAHHPHHLSHKKKWKEYLLEFLMLFLAVFLGFLTENQREHMVEHQREKQFIESYKEDIKADIKNAQTVIEDFKTNKLHMENILANYNYMLNGNGNSYRKDRDFLRSYEDYYITDRTMQQLKNSGGLRLIRNQAVSDNIMAYDNQGKDILDEQEFLKSHYERIWEMENSIINEYAVDSVNKLDPKLKYTSNVLITNDKKELIQYYNRIKHLNSYIPQWVDLMNERKSAGNKLIALLRREYEIE